MKCEQFGTRDRPGRCKNRQYAYNRQTANESDAHDSIPHLLDLFHCPAPRGHDRRQGRFVQIRCLLHLRQVCRPRQVAARRSAGVESRHGANARRSRSITSGCRVGHRPIGVASHCIPLTTAYWLRTTLLAHESFSRHRRRHFRHQGSRHGRVGHDPGQRHGDVPLLPPPPRLERAGPRRLVASHDRGHSIGGEEGQAPARPTSPPIGLSGQMHGSVFLDKRDRVIRRAAHGTTSAPPPNAGKSKTARAAAAS